MKKKLNLFCIFSFISFLFISNTQAVPLPEQISHCITTLAKDYSCGEYDLSVLATKTRAAHATIREIANKFFSKKIYNANVRCIEAALNMFDCIMDNYNQFFMSFISPDADIMQAINFNNTGIIQELEYLSQTIRKYIEPIISHYRYQNSNYIQKTRFFYTSVDNLHETLTEKMKAIKTLQSDPIKWERTKLDYTKKTLQQNVSHGRLCTSLRSNHSSTTSFWFGPKRAPSPLRISYGADK